MTFARCHYWAGRGGACGGWAGLIPEREPAPCWGGDLVPRVPHPEPGWWEQRNTIEPCQRQLRGKRMETNEDNTTKIKRERTAEVLGVCRSSE